MRLFDQVRRSGLRGNRRAIRGGSRQTGLVPGHELAIVLEGVVGPRDRRLSRGVSFSHVLSLSTNKAQGRDEQAEQQDDHAKNDEQFHDRETPRQPLPRPVSTQDLHSKLSTIDDCHRTLE